MKVDIKTRVGVMALTIMWQTFEALGGMVASQIIFKEKYLNNNNYNAAMKGTSWSKFSICLLHTLTHTFILSLNLSINILIFTHRQPWYSIQIGNPITRVRLKNAGCRKGLPMYLWQLSLDIVNTIRQWYSCSVTISELFLSWLSTVNIYVTKTHSYVPWKPLDKF